MKKSIRIALILAGLAGMVLSSLSLQNHYSKSADSFCSIDATFNCDVVNHSIYSEIPITEDHAVPVALIGLLGYLLLLGLSWLAQQKWAARTLLVFAVGGLGFALRLTYIEAHILDTWCLLCLGSLLTITTITVLAALGLRQTGLSPR
ncbi:MAG: vitamin K epoxide reductase family protein [Acidobacteriaceae bacterium]